MDNVSGKEAGEEKSAYAFDRDSHSSKSITAAGFGTTGLIKGRWKVVRKIGQGAFGEIYVGRNVVTSEMIAIKVERVDSKKQVLKLEVSVLKKLQTCEYVVPFITCGRHNDYNYMVMELLGENISELRRRQDSGRFSMMTTLKLGLQMLKGIEAVHELGYLHRDIKPSNFAMGLAAHKKRTCFLIDFGLARRYVLPNGEVRPARGLSGFRGTARYASLHSHNAQDLGRRDDLWSLLYLLIELVTGSLPWRKVKDKDQVGEMKAKYMTPESLVKELPPEFTKWMEHLLSLDYGDKPNYSYLHQTFHDYLTKLDGNEETPFDWERERKTEAHTRPIPSLMDLAFLKVAANFDKIAENRLPIAIKARMFKFMIRIKNGRLSRTSLDKLLDHNFHDLDLSPCELPDSEIDHITTVCTAIQHLSLPTCSDTLMKQIVQHNPHLESLSIICSPKTFSNKAIKTLVEASDKLTVLKLKNSDKITDKSVEIILNRCNNLEELCLAGCKKIKGTCFKVLTKKKTPQKLRRLNLSHCELSKKGFKHLVSIGANMQSLHFFPLCAGFKVTASDFIEIMHQTKNLQQLHLSNFQFELDPVLVEISRTIPRLQVLQLDGVGVSDYGVQNIVQNCRDIESIRFRYGDGVTDDAIQQIAKTCLGLKSITLDFWNNFHQSQTQISDHALKTLLSSCINLTELNLANCYVFTASSFPENEYFPNLLSLNLSDCYNLSDFAMRRITESCPNLKTLELNNVNNLTETSLQYLSVHCPCLEYLSLISCCCFSDDTIRQLLRCMPNLFIQLTRYGDMELRGITREVHAFTVEKIFNTFPNLYREKALDHHKKKIYGLD